MPSQFYENYTDVCPVRVNVDTAKDEVVGVVQQIVEGWAGKSGTVSQIGGGITNLLFKVEGEAGLPVVLVRVFGTNTEVMIDRVADNRTSAELSKRGFAPTYYGQFENGRVEGYIDAAPVECDAMGDPVNVPLIARELRRMHEMDIRPQAPALLFTKIDQWMEMARNLDFSDSPAKAAAYEEFDFVFLEDEVAWLKKTLLEGEVHPFLLENVFSHNDLLNGNILIPNGASPPARVHFIDYEYGGWNLRGFDIGNHWAEFAGTDGDYDKCYPQPACCEQFIRAYIAGHPSFPNPSDDDVKKLARDGNKFSLASHMFWGVWAIIQAKYSPIDFDFMAFARMRLGGFLKHKTQFCA